MGDGMGWDGMGVELSRLSQARPVKRCGVKQRERERERERDAGRGGKKQMETGQSLERRRVGKCL
jgi:hypothetical protein